MNKREFLAVGGAVPLMVAGCGGSSSGSCNLRMVNASVGYPTLGLLVNTTQATTTDVAYGAASPFASVPAGSVTTTLTTTSNGVVTDLPVTSRTLTKNAQYTLVAYGYSSAPKSVLILENQTAPNSGYASFNILNTSTDVGAVDIYLLPTTTLDPTGAAPIASGVTGVSQSVFVQQTAGSYNIVVTGANSVTAGSPDIRLTIQNVALADQQIATLILTPGASGVLANGILLTQGTTGSVANYPNTFARIRAIAATGNSGTVSVGAVVSGNTQVIMNGVASPNFTSYVQVPSSATLQVFTNGTNAVTVVPGNTASTALSAGSDYTLVVYNGSTGPTAELFLDDNRLPAGATDVKVRLLNAVQDTATLPLTLNLNATAVAADVAFGSMSSYAEAPALAQSVVSVTSGFTTVVPSSTVTLTAGNIYTMVVAGVATPNGSTTDVSQVVYNFSGARR